MADQLAAINAQQASTSVSRALRDAARETGVGFDYLYKVAFRESSLDPRAEASTSSAAGLYQFIEQTWLSAVKKHGERHGMQLEARAITEAGGRYHVSDPDQRAAILELRFDPRKSAALAAEFTRDNRDRLEKTLGRAVTSTDLYAAHFLGAGGAETLLTAAPDAEAARLLPQAARANRPVFYDGERARTISELLDDFARSVDAGGEPPALREGPSADEAFAWLTGSDGGAQGGGLTGPLARGLRPTGSLTADRTQINSAQINSDAGRYVPFDRTPIDHAPLSPLALVVLQSLDPLTLRQTDDHRRSDRQSDRQSDR